MRKSRNLLLMAGALMAGALLFAALTLQGCSKEFPSGPSGKIQDEAMFVGRTAATLEGSDDDYLRDMDGGLDADQVYAAMSSLGATFSKEEAWSRYNRGRNNWAVWTGGNDRFWDKM